jgi:cellulose synthase/poly-beta-1,6-N-acetylglucosamine synthase-like glycosyltransferase
MTRSAWIAVICWAAYVYPYLIYPLMLRLMCLRPHAWPRAAHDFNLISHIICAHNERDLIEAKIKNSLEASSRSPQEIVLVCDGCTDGTAEVAGRFRGAARDFKIITTSHTGKTAAQNLAVSRAAGDVLLLSDADTLLGEGTVDRLVGRLADGYSCVGANVRCGRPGEPDSLYTDVEARLKALQGCLGMVIGVHGACYALAREAFVGVKSGVISDLAQPLEVLLRGERVGFEPRAAAYEVSARSSLAGGIARRRRIFCRSMTTLFTGGYLSRALRRPDVFFHVISDKLPRYFLGPLTVIVATASFVAGPRFMLMLSACLAGIAALVLAAMRADTRRWLSSVRAGALFFATANVASFLALWDYATAKDYTRW